MPDMVKVLKNKETMVKKKKTKICRKYGKGDLLRSVENNIQIFIIMKDVN